MRDILGLCHLISTIRSSSSLPVPSASLRVRAERQESGRVFSVTVARRELRKWLRGSEDGMRVEQTVTELLAQ